ncbi:MAG: hypothetical protein KDB14_05100 [Planctomycetales bacterium]|nr:hypothetical protein [Planctomycetales bacterium]
MLDLITIEGAYRGRPAAVQFCRATVDDRPGWEATVIVEGLPVVVMQLPRGERS